MVRQATTGIFTGTRGRVVLLLRETPRTVNELMACLHLTDNAVRFQLDRLRREGLVHASGVRPGRRRPNVVYALTQRGRELFPKPYAALLSAVLDMLGRRLGAARQRALLRACGHRLARELAPSLPSGSRRRRIDEAIRILNELGGLAEHLLVRRTHVIRGQDCPFGALAAAHPEICELAETLVADLVGQPVREECEKGASPRCRFRLLTRI